MIRTVEQLKKRIENKKEGEVINWYKELRLNHTPNRKIVEEIASDDEELYRLLIDNPYIDRRLYSNITSYQELRVRCIDLIDDSEVINFMYECGENLLYKLTEEQIESIFELNISDENKKRFGRYISLNENLSEKIVMKYDKYLFMPGIYNRIDLSKDAMTTLFNKHGYIQILKQKNLTIEFIENVVKSKIRTNNLKLLSNNTKVDESVIDFYFDELDKFNLSFREYSKDFLIKHVNDLNIGALMLYNDLSDIVSKDILDEYNDRLNSCASLQIYKNELFWDEELSGKRNNIYDKNDTDSISRSVYLTKYLIDKYKNILNMDLVKKYQLEYRK